MLAKHLKTLYIVAQRFGAEDDAITVVYIAYNMIVILFWALGFFAADICGFVQLVRFDSRSLFAAAFKNDKHFCTYSMNDEFDFECNQKRINKESYNVSMRSIHSFLFWNIEAQFTICLKAKLSRSTS